ncbi:MAG: hypothetical protein K8J31_02035 [Anaerolineae bacterium]|nr:hypothetical protein [Anaerolineae bacterium]
MKRSLIFALTLMTMLAAAVVPAFAQDHSRTFTKTEAQINQSYRVTNPWRRTLSNVYVDVQEGQVVISATYTTRHTGPFAVETTLVPAITNGRVVWTATTVTRDGVPVSDTLLAQINAQITSSWLYFWRTNGPAGHVTNILVADDAISITVTY